MFVSLSPTSLVMNQIPPTSQLQHIPQLDDPPSLTSAPYISNSVIQPSRPLLLGGRIPPISPKLHKKIIEGHYIDMVELFPEHLEVLNAAEEDHSKSSRPKLKDISSSGAPIRKLTDVPITDILAIVISDIDTDTDN